MSTSSPRASVALYSPQFCLIGSEGMEAPMAASGACLGMLEKLIEGANSHLSDIEIYVADVGPGSFTGVKVAVTLAKTLAFANGKLTAGLSSFDLIAADVVVVIPSRKGEWFVRRSGFAVERIRELPEEKHVGYGAGIQVQAFPDAAKAGNLLRGLEGTSPEALLPNYIAEPSISTPKRPYGATGAASA